MTSTSTSLSTTILTPTTSPPSHTTPQHVYIVTETFTHEERCEPSENMVLAIFSTLSPANALAKERTEGILRLVREEREKYMRREYMGELRKRGGIEKGEGRSEGKEVEVDPYWMKYYQIYESEHEDGEKLFEVYWGCRSVLKVERMVVREKGVDVSELEVLGQLERDGSAFWEDEDVNVEDIVGKEEGEDEYWGPQEQGL